MANKRKKIIESKAGDASQYTKIDDLKVTNQKAYNKFLALRENIWIKEKRYYQSQNDKLLKIDLLAKLGVINKAIKHLPKEEQRYIQALRKIVTNAYHRLTVYKLQALGERMQQSFYGISIDDYLIIDNRKAEILALFGKMWSIQEIHREVVKEWGIDISIDSLQNFRRKNLEKILELQKEYTNDFKTIRLAHKKSRLEEYLWLYNETKQRYETTTSRDDRKFLKDLLESIRREVDGDVLRIEGDISVNVEHTLNVHIHKELLKKLPINEIIITRVAAKTGVNPLLLLYRLQNSYYAKYTGFAPRDQQATYELPEYPSAQVYDLEKLAQLNKAIKDKDNEAQTIFNRIIDIPHKEVDKASKLKDIIKQKLAKRQNALEKGIAKYDGEVRN